MSQTNSDITWVIVDTKHILWNTEVSDVFCFCWSDIIVEMSSITMFAEAVKVIHSQIQALHTAQYIHNEYIIYTICNFSALEVSRRRAI